MSRSDNPPHPAGDDERLQGVGLGHALAEELVAQRRVSMAELWALDFDRPEGGLERARRLPAIAVALRGVVASLIAAPAELVADDLLDDALEREAHRQACYLLQHAQQLPAGAEQVVNLCTDGLSRWYSWCHGCRSPFFDLVVLKEPTPVARLHQGLDASPRTRRVTKEAVHWAAVMLADYSWTL